MLILLMFQLSFQDSVQLQVTEFESDKSKLLMNSVNYPLKMCKNHACRKKSHIWNKSVVHIFSIIKVTNKFIYSFLDPYIFLYFSLKITGIWQSLRILLVLHTSLTDFKVFL
jgi:hypothetical protein